MRRRARRAPSRRVRSASRLERLDAVEQRQQHDRRDIGEPDDEQREKQRRRRATRLRRAPDAPVNRPAAPPASTRPMRKGLQLIAQPAAEGFVRQLVAAFEHEAAVEAERQRDDFVHERQERRHSAKTIAPVCQRRATGRPEPLPAASRSATWPPVQTRPASRTTPHASEIRLAWRFSRWYLVALSSFTRGLVV